MLRTAERYTELLGHSKGALMKAGPDAFVRLGAPRGAGGVPADLPKRR